MAAVELDTVEGAHSRSDVAGQRAVVFPFAWSMQAKWPAQQPCALRLHDRDGHALALPTSLLASPAPREPTRPGPKFE